MLMLAAAYGLKLAWSGETYGADRGGRGVDWVRGAITTFYAVLMLTSGGAKLLMLSALLYAPCTILSVIARREQNRAVFTHVEWLLFGVIAAMAAAGLYGLASGAIAF
jgi:arginine:ornithine antiporter/lysine permease